MPDGKHLVVLGILALGLARASPQTDTGGMGKIAFPTSASGEA